MKIREKNKETVSCILCKSGKAKLLFKTKDRDFKIGEFFCIVKCEKCGFIFTNPRPRIPEITRYYPNNYGPHLKPYIISNNTLVNKVFNIWENYRSIFNINFIKGLTPGKILDVGCGSGSYLNSLKNKGWQVTGMDKSSEAVKQTRALGIKCYEGELFNLNFKNGYFDVITAINSIEHMYDPIKNLKYIKNILKDSGSLVIVIPNAESNGARLFGKNWHEWDVPRHLYHFSLKSIKILLEQSGFRIISVDYESRIDGYLRSLDYVIGEKACFLIRVLSKILYPIFVLFEYKILKEFLIIRAEKS